jgi:PKD repeat protein
MPANPDVNSQPSRPILLLDTENNVIYCVFRDSTYNKSTFFTKTSLTSPGTFQPATILISNKANDGTSTKQHLNSSTDLIAAASQDGDIFWNIIDLSGPPSASFQGTPGSGTAPLVVSFVDTSSDDGGIVSWNWNFGDGFTSTQQHPTHVFRAGTWNVTLQVADAAGNIATANQSITVADAGNPVIQAIAPEVVNIGAVVGDFTLIVDGAAFVNGAVVQFNGANRTTTFVSATRVTATITLADVSAVGQFPITVTLPSSAVSNAINLTVSGDNPAPAITTITPTTTTSSSPAFDLTINGTGFVASSKVWVNGTERVTVYVSPTQLKTNIGATDLAVPLYQIPVWVVNAPPGGGTSNTAFFDITPTCTAPTAPISFVADHQFNSVHSALWYNDGSWWGALSDRTTGTYIWRHNNNQFVKGAQIGTNSLAGPDTLWDGTNLFILSYETSSLGKFYKYSYDSVSKTYSLLAGFPVDIPLTGLASSLTFTKDSTGKIWAAYTGTNNNDGIGDGKLHVIWTTSPDHLTWDSVGTVLETGL